MPIADYKQNDQTLAGLLSEHTLRVPPYQRNYSWGDEEVADFWHDVRDFHAELAGNSEKPGHYLFGTIVLARQNGFAEIIDGQQRLATATVLLACVRNALHSLNSPYAQVLHNSYISLGDDCDNTPFGFRLTLNDADRDFFSCYVQEFPPKPFPPGIQKSKRKLKRAREIIEFELGKWVSELSPEMSASLALRGLIDMVIKRFSFVVISTSDSDSAASIFETLNDRGSKLTVADLLKNLLMTKAKKSHQNTIRDAWRAIDESGLSAESIIRISWTSRHGDVKKRALYKEIRDHLAAGTTEPLTFARDLLNDVECLNAIDRCRTGGQELDDALRDLRELGFKNHYPLTLATWNTKPEHRLGMTRAVLSLAIRHLVVCDGNPLEFETAVLKAACAMHGSDGLHGALRALRELSPSDEQFADCFRQLAFHKRRNQAMVLLRHFEKAMQGTRENEPSKVRRDLHIEHILPVKPKSGVSKAHEKIVHLIGNLTLLASQINVKIKNETFAKKRPEYSRSMIQMTQRLVEHDGMWKEPAIRLRQESLGRQAAKLWPRNLISDSELENLAKGRGRKQSRRDAGNADPSIFHA
jgi:hypothetical protein